MYVEISGRVRLIASNRLVVVIIDLLLIKPPTLKEDALREFVAKKPRDLKQGGQIWVGTVKCPSGLERRNGLGPE